MAVEELVGPLPADWEYATLGGDTIAVVTIPAGSIRPLRQREIAQAREVA
jgi:hypothetical protein